MLWTAIPLGSSLIICEKEALGFAVSKLRCGHALQDKTGMLSNK
jgi:hypothetical protein